MLKTIIALTEFFTEKSSKKFAVLIEKEEYALVAVGGEYTLIFYGSNSLSDWVENFSYPKVNQDGFPIGWTGQASSAFLELEGYKITYVSGYSRGAAIALIYSYYFKAEAIVFCPPKVSKKLLYWPLIPIVIGSLDDPVRFLPFRFYRPGCYITLDILGGGHFWKSKKYKSEIELALINYGF